MNVEVVKHLIWNVLVLKDQRTWRVEYVSHGHADATGEPI